MPHSCKGERFTPNLEKSVPYPLDAWLLITMMMMNRLLLLTILHFVIHTAKAATLFYQTDITLFFHTKRFSILLNSIFVILCVCWVNVSFLRLLYFARNSHFLFVYCASARCFMEPKFYMTDYLLSCQLTKGSALILIYFVLYISVVNCRPQAVYH